MKWIEEYKKRISYLESDKFLDQLEKSEYFIITDKNLEKHYQDSLFPEANYYSIEAGEESKRLSTVEEILEKLLKLNYSHNLIIVGFGGGVVGDIAGFISAIYKRGCCLALMPTSLIAMVDASLGGKNGVNSLNFKNQFGTIKQPDFINYDFKLLSTLPYDEFTNGFPEIIKHGLIHSNDYYNKAKTLSIHNINLLDTNFTQVIELIIESMNIKLSYVCGDENDKGQRRFLNFGHTLGHVVEKEYGIPHGKAVLWGMIQAIKLSYKLGLIPELLSRTLIAELEKLNIVKYDMIKWQDISQALLNDKKRESEKITFILLEGIGKPLVKDIDLEIIEEVVKAKDEAIYR